MTGPRLISGDIRSVGFLWATACEGKYSHVAKLPRLLENKNEGDGWMEREKEGRGRSRDVGSFCSASKGALRVLILMMHMLSVQF